MGEEVRLDLREAEGELGLAELAGVVVGSGIMLEIVPSHIDQASGGSQLARALGVAWPGPCRRSPCRRPSRRRARSGGIGFEERPPLVGIGDVGARAR